MGGEFVVSGGNSAVFFESSDESLRNITLSIKRFVVVALADASASRRNDDRSASHFNLFDDGIAIVSSVGNDVVSPIIEGCLN